MNALKTTLTAAGVLAICNLAQASQAIEILSFTAEPSTIRKGEASILQWRVSGDPENILIIRDRQLPPITRVEAVGQMRVTPDRTASYQLVVRFGDQDTERSVTVQVIEPSGHCTISGRIIRDRREYATTVGLYSPDSETRLFSTSVDKGRYRFSKVPVGRYRVIPEGRYPNGKLALGPKPSYQDVSCQSNRSYTVDFKIVSWEG
jgi:hypothetical protein